MKFLKYFLLIFAILICFQSSSLADAGGEWDIVTPGGNKIGNHHTLPGDTGIAIYEKSDANIDVYVTQVAEYGFYDRSVIGKAKQGFFLFNEKTKDISYFPDKQQLCAKVASEGLKFDNNLRFLRFSYHWDYYAIKYSLYFLFPFLILFLIFYSLMPVKNYYKVNLILKNPGFAILLYIFTVVLNFALLNNKTTAAGTTALDFATAAISIGVIFVPLWLLNLKLLQTLSKNDRTRRGQQANRIDKKSLMRLLIFSIIFGLGLALTIGQLEAASTSVRYFSC